MKKNWILFLSSAVILVIFYILNNKNEKKDSTFQEPIPEQSNFNEVKNNIDLSNPSSKMSPSFDGEKMLILIQDINIPTKNDLKAQRNSAHHRSPEMMRAIEKLSEISALWQSDLRYSEAALSFYEKCVGQIDYPETIRFNCLRNIRKMKNLGGPSSSLDLESLDSELLELEKKFNDL